MKSASLFVLFFVITISQFTSAQIPQTISYQGVLTAADGSPVSDGSYSLTFKLYDVAVNGDSLWQETQNVQVTKGLFNAILGSLTPLNLPFEKQYWLGIAVGNDAELVPRTALTASPYSLNSHSTLVEPEPGQGLTIRNSNGAATHKFDPNGDVTHTGVGTYLSGLVVGDTTLININATFVKNNTSGRQISGGPIFIAVGNEKDAVKGQATLGAGVTGTSVESDGVYGFSENGFGVHGRSINNQGVIGTSDHNNGVSGFAFELDKAGVYGSSEQGVGIRGQGKLGAEFLNKVQLDEVPEAPNQQKFLVWDDDKIIKYRNLPPGGFDGILQDKALIVKSGSDTVFRVEPDGKSFHKGLETFESGVDLPDFLLANTRSVVKAGKFNGGGMRNLSSVQKQQFLAINERLKIDGGTESLNPATDNEPVIWGYTERPSGASIFGQNTNTANSYPANWGVNFGGGAGVVGEVRNTSSNYPAIWAVEYGVGSSLLIDHQGSSGNILTGRSAGVNQVRIDKTGKGFFNGGTQTGGADVAEVFEVKGMVEQYEPGDVMAISTERNRTITKSSEPYSTLVVGVYATKPGVLLTKRNIDDSHEDTVPLGVVGVIPTKVCLENGAIHRGDLLVTSSLPGIAMKGTDRDKLIGAVLGKALEDFDENSTGVIEVLVNTK